MSCLVFLWFQQLVKNRAVGRKLTTCFVLFVGANSRLLSKLLIAIIKIIYIFPIKKKRPYIKKRIDDELRSVHGMLTELRKQSYCYASNCAIDNALHSD